MSDRKTFRPLGIRLQRFARQHLYRYLASTNEPAMRELPPSWRQQAEEPLVWSQENQLPPSSAAPELPATSPAPSLPPQQRSAPPQVSRQTSPAPQKQGGLPNDLLRLMEIHEQRKEQSAREAEERRAQRKAEGLEIPTPPPLGKRNRASFNYVKPLVSQDEVPALTGGETRNESTTSSDVVTDESSGSEDAEISIQRDAEPEADQNDEFDTVVDDSDTIYAPPYRTHDAINRAVGDSSATDETIRSSNTVFRQLATDTGNYPESSTYSDEAGNPSSNFSPDADETIRAKNAIAPETDTPPDDPPPSQPPSAPGSRLDEHHDQTQATVRGNPPPTGSIQTAKDSAPPHENSLWQSPAHDTFSEPSAGISDLPALSGQNLETSPSTPHDDVASVESGFALPSDSDSANPDSTEVHSRIQRSTYTLDQRETPVEYGPLKNNQLTDTDAFPITHAASDDDPRSYADTALPASNVTGDENSFERDIPFLAETNTGVEPAQSPHVVSQPRASAPIQRETAPLTPDTPSAETPFTPYAAHAGDEPSATDHKSDSAPFNFAPDPAVESDISTVGQSLSPVSVQREIASPKVFADTESDIVDEATLDDRLPAEIDDLDVAPTTIFNSPFAPAVDTDSDEFDSELSQDAHNDFTASTDTDLPHQSLPPVSIQRDTVPPQVDFPLVETYVADETTFDPVETEASDDFHSTANSPSAPDMDTEGYDFDADLSQAAYNDLTASSDTDIPYPTQSSVSVQRETISPQAFVDIPLVETEPTVDIVETEYSSHAETDASYEPLMPSDSPTAREVNRDAIDFDPAPSTEYFDPFPESANPDLFSQPQPPVTVQREMVSPQAFADIRPVETDATDEGYQGAVTSDLPFTPNIDTVDFYADPWAADFDPFTAPTDTQPPHQSHPDVSLQRETAMSDEPDNARWVEPGEVGELHTSSAETDDIYGVPATASNSPSAPDLDTAGYDFDADQPPADFNHFTASADTDVQRQSQPDLSVQRQMVSPQTFADIPSVEIDTADEPTANHVQAEYRSFNGPDSEYDLPTTDVNRDIIDFDPAPLTANFDPFTAPPDTQNSPQSQPPGVVQRDTLLPAHHEASESYREESQSDYEEPLGQSVEFVSQTDEPLTFEATSPSAWQNTVDLSWAVDQYEVLANRPDPVFNDEIDLDTPHLTPDQSVNSPQFAVDQPHTVQRSAENEVGYDEYADLTFDHNLTETPLTHPGADSPDFSQPHPSSRIIPVQRSWEQTDDQLFSQSDDSDWVDNSQFFDESAAEARSASDADQWNRLYTSNQANADSHHLQRFNQTLPARDPDDQSWDGQYHPIDEGDVPFEDAAWSPAESNPYSTQQHSTSYQSDDFSRAAANSQSVQREIDQSQASSGQSQSQPSPEQIWRWRDSSPEFSDGEAEAYNADSAVSTQQYSLRDQREDFYMESSADDNIQRSISSDTPSTRYSPAENTAPRDFQSTPDTLGQNVDDEPDIPPDLFEALVSAGMVTLSSAARSTNISRQFEFDNQSESTENTETHEAISADTDVEALIPHTNSVEADLLDMLGLPGNTPVLGLHPSHSEHPSVSRSTVIDEDEPHVSSKPSPSQSWSQADVEAVTPQANSAESDLLDMLGLPGNTPVPGLHSSNSEHPIVSRSTVIDEDETHISSKPVLPQSVSQPDVPVHTQIQRAEVDPSNDTESHETNDSINIEDLARKVYRILRDRLRTERERHDR